MLGHSQEGHWIKIRVDFPGSDGSRKRFPFEISSQEKLFDTLSTIWGLLNDECSFAPEAFTYHWDWILLRKEDDRPLVAMGFMSAISSFQIFKDGEIWVAKRLEKPVFADTARLGFFKGSPEFW